MASKTPIEIKMTSWFALAPPAEATKQFQVIRAILSDRKLLGRGTKSASAKPAKVKSNAASSSVAEGAHVI